MLVFVLNRSKLLELIGKYLTPLIIFILLAIILLGLFSESDTSGSSIFDNSFTAGIIEGYQTFDAIGGVVVGGVIVISFALQGVYSYAEKRRMIAKSGFFAGLGLFVIYTGLIAVGATYSGETVVEHRTELLGLLSTNTLGNIGTAFLAVLVALACFTTAVGVVTGTADFVKGLFAGSRKAYMFTAVAGCLIGILVGQQAVGYIIEIAVPALMIIYPITIALILLSVLPESYRTRLTYRIVIVAAIVFSIPDFIETLPFRLISESSVNAIKEAIPLSDKGMGWVLPTLIGFIVARLIEHFRPFKKRPLKN